MGTNTIGVRVFLLLAGLLFTPAMWGQQWQVDYDTSRVGFVATYDEIPFAADFKDFEADIRFDPLTIDQASFKVSVGIASVDSNSTDRDEGMLESDWFDAGKHPYSTFTSVAVQKLGSEDLFTVSGDLIIKGVSKPAQFVFSWTTTEESISLKGQTEVKRSDFSIGTGDWAEDDTIGFNVQIVFDLNLHRM